MNNFVVPQFIDVEAKILGPVTLRQFVISLIGGFFLVAAYKLFDMGLFVIAFLVVGGLVFLFGFFKVNGRPFHLFIISVLETLKRPAIRVWRVVPGVQVKTPAPLGELGNMAELSASTRKAPTRSRLQQLTLVVDTGGVYKNDE